MNGIRVSFALLCLLGLVACKGQQEIPVETGMSGEDAGAMADEGKGAMSGMTDDAAGQLKGAADPEAAAESLTQQIRDKESDIQATRDEIAKLSPEEKAGDAGTGLIGKLEQQLADLAALKEKLMSSVETLKTLGVDVSKYTSLLDGMK